VKKDAVSIFTNITLCGLVGFYQMFDALYFRISSDFSGVAKCKNSSVFYCAILITVIISLEADQYTHYAHCPLYFRPVLPPEHKELMLSCKPQEII
jgi:hypothetical protein